ncbi:hypothetical protein BLNAU_18222 [Blattamonas nauphoetae]|uniref:Uncharacterized protein n=1 Tax=Blattamonas nauphoetae TaxID=2049346 RepID=A0ABQ9X4Y9_9EUKA|nr:hypothetical protein BLNAU_18222 [Blattamonas nauphoetae]
MKTLLSHKSFNKTSLSCPCRKQVNLTRSDSIDSDRQHSTFTARGSIPIPLTTLTSLLHTHKSHLRVKNTTIAPCKGITDSGNSSFFYPLVVAEEISSGIVSVTVTALSQRYSGDFVGLMESPCPNPEVDTGLGHKLKWCFSLWSNDGCVWKQQGPVYEYQHREAFHPPLNEGDCVRMEVNMDSKPRTLQFFVNGEAGQSYVSGLPTLVRVAFIAYSEESSVRVDRIVRQSNATPIKPGTRRLNWDDLNSRKPTYPYVIHSPRHSDW